MGGGGGGGGGGEGASPCTTRKSQTNKLAPSGCIAGVALRASLADKSAKLTSQNNDCNISPTNTIYRSAASSFKNIVGDIA